MAINLWNMSEGFQRKLAAIVAADVVGFSALMGEDETGTIAAVRSLHQDVIDPLLAQFGGRMVKTMGDGFLMEFASVVAGVEAALALQKQLAQGVSAMPVKLRIGVHMGDVVVDGQDLFGDGVNIAARIEALAAPGGIGVSDDAYQQVRARVPVDWIDGGLAELKNIARPVRIWHWDNGETVPTLEPALALPDKPSVAVLPFDNMSRDPEQEYFADGMTEDLITDLSKISGLFVVARNSTFVFKGQAIDVPSVGRKLGVKNVIEGSIRKMGERVRINVQLIDATTGGHVWADRFDGAVSDVFELQDDVCRAVVEAMSVQLTSTEAERLKDVPTSNIAAYELYVQAKSTPYPPIPSRIAAAKAQFEKVIELEPNFGGGYVGLAWMISFNGLWGYGDSEAIGLRAEALVYKAITIDPSFAWSHTILGLSLLVQRRFDEAIAACEKCIELMPNDAEAHSFYAMVKTMSGRPEEGVLAVENAIRLSPNFVNGPYLNIKCLSLMLAGHYEEALQAFQSNVARGGPVGPPAFAWAVACHQALGQTEPVAGLVAKIKKMAPDFTLEGWNLLGLIRHDADRARIAQLMIDGGL